VISNPDAQYQIELRDTITRYKTSFRLSPAMGPNVLCFCVPESEGYRAYIKGLNENFDIVSLWRGDLSFEVSKEVSKTMTTAGEYEAIKMAALHSVNRWGRLGADYRCRKWFKNRDGILEVLCDHDDKDKPIIHTRSLIGIL
jgi:hypothetical protein